MAEEISDRIIAAAQVLDRRSHEGLIVGYHATGAPEAVAHEGLVPRSSGKTETVWEGGEFEPFVSQDHVYFFQHIEDAATYFDHNRMPDHAKSRREESAVYSAQLPVDRLDVDPEDLALMMRSPRQLPISHRRSYDEHDDAVIMAGNDILRELYHQFEHGNGPNLLADGQSAESVEMAWQLYQKLPEIKRQVLVAACMYGEAGTSANVRLMHRGAIEDLRYENVASVWARMDERGRSRYEGKYERYIKHLLAEKAWPVRRESPLYKSLQDHHARMAFRECAWIESDDQLTQEIERRMQSREQTNNIMQMRRQRRLEQNPERAERDRREGDENDRIHAQRREVEAQWLDQDSALPPHLTSLDEMTPEQIMQIVRDDPHGRYGL